MNDGSGVVLRPEAMNVSPIRADVQTSVRDGETEGDGIQFDRLKDLFGLGIDESNSLVAPGDDGSASPGAEKLFLATVAFSSPTKTMSSSRPAIAPQ